MIRFLLWGNFRNYVGKPTLVKLSVPSLSSGEGEVQCTDVAASAAGLTLFTKCKHTVFVPNHPNSNPTFVQPCDPNSFPTDVHSVTANDTHVFVVGSKQLSIHETSAGSGVGKCVRTIESGEDRDIVKVSVGPKHGHVLMNDGTVWMFPDVVTAAEPEMYFIERGLSVTDVAGGEGWSMFRVADGRVFGRNYGGLAVESQGVFTSRGKITRSIPWDRSMRQQVLVQPPPQLYFKEKMNKKGMPKPLSESPDADPGAEPITDPMKMVYQRAQPSQRIKCIGSARTMAIYLTNDGDIYFKGTSLKVKSFEAARTGLFRFPHSSANNRGGVFGVQGCVLYTEQRSLVLIGAHEPLPMCEIWNGDEGGKVDWKRKVGLGSTYAAVLPPFEKEEQLEVVEW
eukprot:PhF_6_TR14182/c0_g1_i2/m.22708